RCPWSPGYRTPFQRDFFTGVAPPSPPPSELPAGRAFLTSATSPSILAKRGSSPLATAAAMSSTVRLLDTSMPPGAGLISLGVDTEVALGKFLPGPPAMG